MGRNPPDRQEGRQGREKIGKAGKFKWEFISRQATLQRAPVGRAPGKSPVIPGVKNVLSPSVLGNKCGGQRGRCPHQSCPEKVSHSGCPERPSYCKLLYEPQDSNALSQELSISIANSELP